MHQPHAGNGSPRSRRETISGQGQSAAGAVAADRYPARLHALCEQPAIGLKRIVKRRRKRMLRRAPVVDRKRPRLRRPAGLRHHRAVTDDRSGGEAAAVQIEQDAGGIRAGRDAPFRRHAAGTHRVEADIFGRLVCVTERVQPLAALGDAGRSRPQGKQCPQSRDLVLAHRLAPLGVRAKAQTPSTDNIRSRH